MAFLDLQVLLILHESEAREFFLSLDEIDSHIALEDFFKGVIKHVKSFHDEGFREESLGQLRVRNLYEDLKLLFLGKELHLYLCLRTLLAVYERDQRLHAAFDHWDLDLIFVLGLNV